MKKFISIYVVLLSSLILYASSFLFEKKGESNIHQYKENNLLTTSIQTQDYRLIDSYNEQGTLNSQLLDIQKKMTTYEGLDGEKGILQLQLFKTKDKKFDTLVWQIKDDSSYWYYQYEPELLITQKGGCCGALNGARAYNFKTGKLILSYTPFIQDLGYQDLPFIIEIPNTKIYRMIGILSTDSARDFPPEIIPRDSQGYSPVGIVKYTDESSILQKFLIKIKVPENFAPSLNEIKWTINESSKNEIQSGKITLWDLDGKTDPTLIGGFSLNISMFGDSTLETIKIPIVNDKLDLSNSMVPENVILMPL